MFILGLISRPEGLLHRWSTGPPTFKSGFVSHVVFCLQQVSRHGNHWAVLDGFRFRWRRASALRFAGVGKGWLQPLRYLLALEMLKPLSW